MDPITMAMIMSQRAYAHEARSALPDAPTVACVDKAPVAPRTRQTLADALRHLADVVAPLPAGHAATRPTLRARN
jgi:hypothetical protein